MSTKKSVVRDRHTAADEDEALAELEYEQLEVELETVGKKADNDLEEFTTQEEFDSVVEGFEAFVGDDDEPEVCAPDVDHRTRFEKFQKSKGSMARQAQERKKQTGHAIDIPTPEEVVAVEEGRAKALAKQKSLAAKNEVKKIVNSHGEEVSSVPKQQRRKMEKTPAAKKQELKREAERDRHTVFEEEPHRTDWKPSDVVNMDKMHPAMRRAYMLFFRDIKSRMPSMTYGQAKASLKKMGHPLRYMRRMSEKFAPRI